MQQDVFENVAPTLRKLVPIAGSMGIQFLDSLVLREIFLPVSQQAIGEGIETLNTKGLTCSRLENVMAVEVCVFLSSLCDVRACTCLTSSSVDEDLQRSNQSHHLLLFFSL